MKLKFIKKLLCLFTSVLLASSFAVAEPENKADFNVTSGLVDIPDGSFVDGSHRRGGIQPDYHVDYKHPEIQRLIRYARRVERSEPDFWKRIDRISSYIRSWHLPGREYENESYLKLNKKFLEQGKDVPLGEYSACRAGVCRENGLYLHIAMKEAGIENYHGYAQIMRSSRFHNYEIVEDHAFTVVKHKGELWVVDSYYGGFNGFKLEDLMSKDGVTKKSAAAPIANPQPGFRRIIKINPFPQVYVPKKAGPPRTLTVNNFFKVPKPVSCENYYRELVPAQ